MKDIQQKELLKILHELTTVFENGIEISHLIEMEERPVLLTRPRVLSSSLPVRPASASQLERQGTFRSTISDEPPSPAPSSRSLSIQEFQDTVKRLEKWEKSKLDKRQTLKKELANEEVITRKR